MNTPGPWQLGQLTDADIRSVYAGDYEITMEERDETGLANARLIASAPELLEALEKALEYLSLNNTPVLDLLAELEVKESARAAIAKAKGGAL